MMPLVACSADRSDTVRKAFARFGGRYVLYVSKKDSRVYVYGRDLKVAASYRSACGLNPDGKRKLYSGDNRTPEGEYRIVDILSMDAQKDSDAYRKLMMMNRIYFRAREGHYKYGKPSVDLGDNAYGPRFYLLDYPNKADTVRYEEAVKRGEVPLKKGSPLPIGYGIALHGNNDEDSIGGLATSGCIRMYNEDIVEMEKYIMIGTPVIISAR